MQSVQTSIMLGTGYRLTYCVCLPGLITRQLLFMSPLRRHYIRLLHGKIGILEGFSALAPYTGVGPI